MTETTKPIMPVGNVTVDRIDENHHKLTADQFDVLNQTPDGLRKACMIKVFRSTNGKRLYNG